MLATLAVTHGVAARMLLPSALTAANLTNLDLSDAALICLSYFDCKAPARIHYAVRRAKSKAPDAKVMLGLWTATDTVLEEIKAEVGADFAVNTLHEAATIILAEASGSQSVRDDAKPSNAIPEPSEPNSGPGTTPSHQTQFRSRQNRIQDRSGPLPRHSKCRPRLRSSLATAQSPRVPIPANHPQCDFTS
jgi:hypothetical protein